MNIAMVGDDVKLGVELGHPMEPNMLWGRLVGILHRKKRWAVVRCYKNGDRVGIPTGEYKTTFLAVPYSPDGSYRIRMD